MQILGRHSVLAVATLGLFSACGGGGSSGGGGGGTPTGAVSFSLTDAASDEIESFVVDVTQVQLHKVGGAVFDVISAPVTVDLATLTDTTQLMNIAIVPAGVYVSATITLDFTNASCVLVGQTTPAAIVDDSGAPVTGTLTLPMQFGQSSFTVAGSRHRLLEFDFDLNQSLDVDSMANSVKLEPAFVLRKDGSGKSLVTLGELVSVDTNGLEFVGSVKTLHGMVLGNATYFSSPTTIFQVDGVPGLGTVGLALLAAKPVGTWVQVYGTIDPNSARIRALYVEAGTGTFNGGNDIVEGHIIDRVGNPAAGADVTLTVRGHSDNSTHTMFQFDTTFTVNTSFANTKVVRRDSVQAFDTDDLNVGQRVRIFGTLVGTTLNAASVIREQPTRVFGLANAAISLGTLTMDLNHVDLRPQASFTWADSGTTPPTPATFTVSSGLLGNSLGVMTGTAVEARGFVAAIDDSNQDFTATSLANLDTAPSLLFVKNLAGGFTVGTTTGSTQILLNITGTAGPGERAFVDHGFAGTVPLPTSPVPAVQPAAATGLYVIRDKVTGSVTVYLAFSPFSTALGTVLAQGATIKTFGAIGTYDAVMNSMQATVVSAVVE